MQLLMPFDEQSMTLQHDIPCRTIYFNNVQLKFGWIKGMIVNWDFMFALFLRRGIRNELVNSKLHQVFTIWSFQEGSQPCYFSVSFDPDNNFGL